jgi:predicted lipoprotein with Yx(FWY)xxD motif
MSILKFTKSILIIVTIIFINSCNSDKVTPLPDFDLSINSTKLGNVITDGKGRTLYFHSNDITTTTTNIGTNDAKWPPYTSNNPRIDFAINPDKNPLTVKDDFGTLKLDNGKFQITYKGWPLYYNAADTLKGNISGEAVGKKWYVAKINYSIFMAETQLIGNNNKSYLNTYKEGKDNTQFLVDDKGRTFYYFVRDKKNTNNFHTKDNNYSQATWQAVKSYSFKDLPSTVDKSLFGEFEVRFGETFIKQMTFKGWPLYYYIGDIDAKGITTRGSTKGVSVPLPGIWPIINLETELAPEKL